MLGLDPQNTTVKRIFQVWEQRSEERRPYLGASIIGKECDRFLWLAFRWAFAPEKFEGRMLRLFDRGHREEPVMIAELESIGCTVEGTQHEEVFANGHGKAHCDAVILGLVEAPKTWHVGDFKTMSEKRFKQFVACKDEEAFHEAFPEYFGQLQIEMELMGLTRSVLIAVNKNTDDLHLLRMKNVAGKYYVERAEKTVADTAPQACERKPTDFRCRFCPAHKLCHGLACAEVNCRTCCYSTPVEDGKWTCSKYGPEEVVPEDILKMGCQHHMFIPGILKFEFKDYGNGWVLYDNGLVNAGADTVLPESLEFQARATSVEIKRNFKALSTGDFSTLEGERISFPEEDAFKACEAEGDERKQQLLDLIEQGDEAAKSDYFKEYGNQQGEKQ